MITREIIFVNRYFAPDESATAQVLTDLSADLVRAGHRVTVLTSRQRLEDPRAGLPRRQIIDGVRVVRLTTSRFGRHRLSGRAVDYATFLLAAAWWLLLYLRRSQLVVFKTDPPMMSAFVWPVVQLRGARYGNWLQDLFPEIALNLGVVRNPGLFARILLRCRNVALRRATFNIAISEAMHAKIAELGADSRVIPNFADCRAITPIARADNPMLEHIPSADRFIVGYSGNFGLVHDFSDLIAVIHQQPDMHFLLVGSGVAHEAVKRQLQSVTGQVTFQRFAPRSALAHSISMADCHVVMMRPELEGLMFPSKIFAIAAAARPMILIGDPRSEIARMMERHQIGIVVRSGDPDAVRLALESLRDDAGLREAMGKRARTLVCQHYGRDHAANAWLRLVDEVATLDHARCANQ